MGRAEQSLVLSKGRKEVSVLNAEYRRSSCSQRDSAEHEEYVRVQSSGRPEVREQDGADLLEEILDGNNLNRAFMRARAN